MASKTKARMLSHLGLCFITAYLLSVVDADRPVDAEPVH
jgi:hypothetical protein